MINKELLDFIKDQTQKGATKEVVSKELLSAGWTVTDIEEAFSSLTLPSITKTEVSAPVQPMTPSANANINPAPKIDLSAPQSIDQFGFQPKTEPSIKKEPEIKTEPKPAASPETKFEAIQPEIKKIEPRIIEPEMKPQPQPIIQSQTPVSNFGSFTSYGNQMSQEATVIKEKRGSAMKTFLIVFLIFVLVVGTLGFVFKDKLVNYFVAKNDTGTEPIAPVPEANEVVNEIPKANDVVLDETPTTKQNINQPEATAPKEEPKEFTNMDPFFRYIGSGCKIVSNCNGPIICTDSDAAADMMSTCVALPEYACYKVDSVRCEKQTKGSCAWTETKILKSCLTEARKKTTS